MAMPASGQISLGDYYGEQYEAVPSANAHIYLKDAVRSTEGVWDIPCAEGSDPQQLSDFYGTAKIDKK
jgi:hypothetical protein